MNGETKKILGFIAFGVALYAVLMNFGSVTFSFNQMISMAMPLLVGLLLAFVINVPMKGFEKLLGKFIKGTGRKGKSRKGMIRGLSLALTFICIILVFIIIFTLVIPELVGSVTNLYQVVEAKIPQFISYLEGLEWNFDAIISWLGDFDLKSIVQKALGGVGDVFGFIVGVTTSTVSMLVSAVLGIIMAAYILMSKDDLARQSKKLLYAYCKSTIADRICYVCRMISDTYNKFLSGQCVEAVILGVLMFSTLSLSRMPYAALIGAMTAALSFIPIVGSFLSCLIGAVLVFLLYPSKVILFIIVFQATQFVENQFIYPYVVGNSVGLSALWTLVAVLVGGQFFGVLGMIFFIPLTAVIYRLVSEGTNKRIERKRLAAGGSSKGGSGSSKGGGDAAEHGGPSAEHGGAAKK